MQRRTLVLAGAFLLLAGAYALFEVRGGRERDRARDRDRALYPVPAGEVVRVRVSGGAHLAERDGALRLSPAAGAPPDAAADTLAAAEFVARLLGARWERRLTVPRDSLRAYGLDPPLAWGAVRARDGREMTIDLGAEATWSNAIYARDRVTGECGLVRSSVAHDFATGADALRDRRLIARAIRAIDSIRVDRPSGPMILARGPDRTWRLESPVRGRASSAAVSSWLEEILSLRARAFLDTLGDDPAALVARLPAPVRRLALASGDPRGSALLAAGGAPLPDGLVAVVATAQPRPVLVDARVAELLDQSADSLRDTRLFRHFTDEAFALQIAQGFDTLEAERGSAAGAWRVVRPETLETDPVRVRALLRNLDADAIAAWTADVSASEAGLASPRASARLRFETPPNREGLFVGAPAPGGGFYAAYEDDPGEILIVPDRIAAILSPDPVAFEDSRLLAGALDSARELSVAVSGVLETRLERDDRTGWRADRHGAPLEPSRAERIAAALAGIESLDRFAPVANDSALGLAAPVLSVEWDGPRAGRFVVGGLLDPARRFARLSGRRALYVVDAAVVDSLRALLEPRR